MPLRIPLLAKRTDLIRRLKKIFRRFRSQPLDRVIEKINPMLAGWVNYFRVGDSGKCFGFVREWIGRKVRRHLMRARQRKGFGWKRWSNRWIHETLGLFDNYRLVSRSGVKVSPV